MSSVPIFKPNRAGYKEILKSAEVKSMLKGKAERVASAARAGTDMPIIVEDKTGQRARYRIVAKHPKAMLVEARSRLLGRALNSAG